VNLTVGQKSHIQAEKNVRLKRTLGVRFIAPIPTAVFIHTFYLKIGTIGGWSKPSRWLALPS
jgi:hypothetical protein